MYLPRKIMEQCRICPTKSQSLHTLPLKITEPCEIMEHCRLCPTKSRRHSFRRQKSKKKYLKLGFPFFFLFFCYQSMVSQRSFQPLGSLFKENILCVTKPLSYEMVHFLPTTTPSSLKTSLLRRLQGRPFPTQLHQ